MLKVALSILAFLFVLTTDSFTQGSSQQQVKALLQVVKEKHYSPRTVDDNFSEYLFTRVFESLDPDKIFFTVSDLSDLSAYKTTLDDELNGKSWTFLNKIIPLYRKRLLQADTAIADITSKPFDFSLNEFLSAAAA